LLDSPNIGPPPVAHFDVEGSLSPNPLVEDFEFTKIKNEKDVARLSLDTDMTSKDAGNLWQDTAPAIGKPAAELAGRPIKSGSKRKFSSRDENDRFPSGLNVIVDDFQLSCSVNVSHEEQRRIVAPDSDLPCEYKRSAGGGPKHSRISKRKVLEPSVCHFSLAVRVLILTFSS
jgi:hypothetical protein